MKLMLTLGLLILSFAGFAQADSSGSKSTITTSVYSITYPATWRVDTSKTRGADLFLFSPVESVGDQFSENVNLIIQNLGGKNISLEKYKEISDRQISNMSVAVEVTESAIVQNEHGSFYRMQYGMINGKFKLKIISICYIKNSKAYLLTFTSEEDKYDHYKNIADHILQSFSLLN